jgi:mRNA interferase ChpB
VVSPDRFNTLTRMPIVVPITTGGAFARNAGFAVSLTAAGTRTTGVAHCDQPRPLDLAARNGRKLESVPQHILDDVLAKLATLFT